jgi:PAS domain S-box-containing protein
VVVDESPPGWSAQVVLDEIRAAGLTTPVVVVCDPAHEDAGIELVERGAADCLDADRLARLPLAVRAAVERDELSRTSARLRVASDGWEAMLRAAFESSPTAVIAVDAAARVIECNPSTERLLGWTEQEARGRSLAELVGEDEGAGQLLVAISEAAAERAPRRHIVPLGLRRRDGQALQVEVWLSHRSGELAGVVVALTDITERWRAGWLMEHQLTVLGALATSYDDGSLVRALEQIAVSVRGTETRLWEADARGPARLRAIWRGAGADGAAGPLVPPPPPGFVEETIRTGRLSFSEAGSAQALGDGLAVPLTSGKRMVGAIEIWAPDFVGFDDLYVMYLSSLGSHLGSHLAQRRTEADFTRSLEELHRIDAERRRLMRRLVEAHEDERRTLAADIHDDPLQVMAAVSLRLHSLRRQLDSQPAQRTLEAVEGMVGGAVARLRSLMFNLRPTGLDHGDLMGPLRDRLEQVHQDDLLEYGLTGSEPEMLTTEERVTLYRIAQEAISNVVKHASASRIDVAVSEQDGGCLLRIADDGSGPGGAVEGRPGHLGLPSMRERCELSGGWLRISAGEPAGTVVSAWVPLPSRPGRSG